MLNECALKENRMQTIQRILNALNEIEEKTFKLNKSN
jgi:hypothetical protein